jgi:hypothetical protein
MYKKQGHYGSGDNVAGNKNLNFYLSKDDSGLDALRKNKIFGLLNNKENINIANNDVLDALKSIMFETIDEEQSKSHKIVPIVNIWRRFENLLKKDAFELLIKLLKEEKAITISNTDVCYINIESEMERKFEI